MTRTNPARFARFAEAYRTGLREAVRKGGGYFLRPGESPDDYAARTAERMLAAIQSKNLSSVHVAGDGFRNACKTLGIKFGREHLRAYLEGSDG